MKKLSLITLIIILTCTIACTIEYQVDVASPIVNITVDTLNVEVPNK